ncbi:hypothetical protein G9A89_013278 [Geosiphon pyriformis]|nr:hypothetical protein G9A89_013278 [Geosiphon pyriformis]
MTEITAHCSKNHSTSLENNSQSNFLEKDNIPILLPSAIKVDTEHQYNLTENQYYQQSSKSGRIRNHRDKPFKIRQILILTCLGGTVNIELAKENFYTELFQHTSLPRNYSFTPIIRNINQTIERYTQQQFPITYADKGKERLQTPAVIPKQIQPPNWKKTQVESLTNPSYYYTPRSAINITSTDMSTSNATSTFGCFPFQSKQQKTELLRPYSDYFEGFKLRRTEKKKSEDQEFTYQNLIPENPEIETPNFQTQHNQNNQNPNINNQQHLPSIIIINPLPQLLLQLQQQLQQPNLDPMAYISIAKLEKFTGKKDNAQNDARAMQVIPYFLQDITDLWYQNFNAFKIEFLRYFSNNNSINRLANTFITIKQEENKAVTTYLRHFHRNLHQIQAIDANYFTVTQILNQFIRRLCTAVTNAKDFEATELEANHAQAINLVINRSFKLDFKLKQFSDFINQKLEGYLADNHNQSRPSLLTNQQWQQKTRVCHYCGKQEHLQINSILSELLTYDAAVILSTTSISNANLLTDSTSNLSATATTYLPAAVSGNISAPTNLNTTTELTSKQNPKAEIDPTKLEIVNSKLFKSTATITENESLDTIFLFELEKPSTMLLFSGVALKEKPITAMYTNAKVDGHSIKLIIDSRLAGSIITKQLIDQLGRQVDCAASARIITTDGATKTPIGEIDDFSFKVNGIIILIKALVRNDWLSKTNTILDWMTQKLQLSQNAMCGHFKTTNLTTPLIKFEEEEKKPTWEAY